MSHTTVSRIDSLRALAEKEPNNALIRYMLANEYLKGNQYEDALKELERYFGMADDEGSGYRMQAMAHLGLGMEDSARDAYRRGIEAARRHHHASMVSEFEAAIEDLS